MEVQQRQQGELPENFWVEFVGDGPCEDADRDKIRDALKTLPDLPYQHSKGTDRFVARNDFRALADDLDAEEERAEKDAWRELRSGPDVTEADKEKARLGALQSATLGPDSQRLTQACKVAVNSAMPRVPLI